MIKVSKLADYAVVILASMAGKDDVMSAGQLAQATDLPEPTVAKILKLLAAGGMVASTRGAGGGYRMIVTLDRVSIAGIIRAIDGPIALTSCVDDEDLSCGLRNSCAVKGRWSGVNRAVNAALENVTLTDMIKPPCVANSRRVA